MGRFTMQAVVESAQLFTKEHSGFAGSEDTIARLLWQASEDDEFRRHVLEILGVSAECIERRCSGARSMNSAQAQEAQPVHQLPLHQKKGDSTNGEAKIEEQHNKKRKVGDPRLSPVPVYERLPPAQKAQRPPSHPKNASPSSRPPQPVENNAKPTILLVRNLWEREPSEADIRQAFGWYEIGRITIHPGRSTNETTVELEVSSRSLATKISSRMDRLEIRGRPLWVRELSRAESAALRRTSEVVPQQGTLKSWQK